MASRQPANLGAIRGKTLKWRMVLCKQQLGMGQSVLRDRETPLGKAGHSEIER